MKLHAEYPIRTICQTLDIHRSSIYYQPSAERQQLEMRLRDRIETLAAKHPKYGYRMMTALLKREGHDVGSRRMARIMKEENLQVQVKRYCKRVFEKL